MTEPGGPEPLLLDTHAWIWFVTGQAKSFERRTWNAIDRACGRGQCAVSVISVWELGMLTAKGRLTLGLSPGEWVKHAFDNSPISLVPLSPEAALEASYLPGPFHGDPADRLLVATARQLRARLVTSDEKILDYSLRKHLNILAC